jgi:hypothetical protein
MAAPALKDRSMRESFIRKDFQEKTRAVIIQANSIIADYEKQRIKLTLRALYYQFVQRNWIKNEQSEYKRLGEILNDARLAGLVDWDALEDTTRDLAPTPMWGDPGDPASPSDFILDWGEHFKNNPWNNQPRYAEVWIEKSAGINVIAQPCRRWRTPYFACRGHVSASEMYDAAKRLHHIADMGQEVTILHIGDHDPSGWQMTQDIAKRLDLLTYGGVLDDRITVKRIALNMDQIRRFRPPPQPGKKTDSRIGAYKRQFGTTDSWELDALQPQYLRDLVDQELRALIDMELWERDVEAEVEPKRLLLEAGERWTEVVDFLGREDE